MFHALLLLSGIYLGGVVALFFALYVKNVAAVFDGKNKISTVDLYAEAFLWPIGVMFILVNGRDRVGDALGFDQDRRRLQRMFEEQEEVIAEADKIMASMTEHSNRLCESLLEQSDLLVALVDIGTRCDVCSGVVVDLLSKNVASRRAQRAEPSTEPSPLRTVLPPELSDVADVADAHYRAHKEFYDELREESRVATHVRCVERLNPHVSCRKRATYAESGRAMPMMCEDHRDDDSVLVGEMRLDERPNVVRDILREVQ